MDSSSGLPGVLQQIDHIAKDEGRVALLFKPHLLLDDRLARLDSAMGDHQVAGAGGAVLSLEEVNFLPTDAN